MSTVGSPCRSGPGELIQQSLLTFLLRVYPMTTCQANRLTEDQGVQVFFACHMWQEFLSQHLRNPGAGHFDPLVVQFQSQRSKGRSEAVIDAFDVIERT